MTAVDSPVVSATSIVTTVLDDRNGLLALLDALAAQTVPPAELVVVIGGSTDGTREVLADWNGPFPLRVIEAPGSNISEGRNIGIRAAAGERVACTDAGCRPLPGWIEAFDRAGEVDLATGIYLVQGQTPLERALAVSLYPSPDEISDESLPTRTWQRLFGRRFEADHATGRSMAFSKHAWEQAGGFREDLHAGEDIAFSQDVVRAGLEARLVPEAAVEWRPRTSWSSNSHMYRAYARGDVRVGGEAKRHVIRLATWIAGPLLVLRGGRAGRLLVLLGAAGYVSLPMRRATRTGMPVREWWRIPLTIALKDLSQLIGAGQGLVDHARGIRQPPPKRPADKTTA